MKAVILAGGIGSRLQPIIGKEIPKVMLKYGEKPLLQIIIENLKEVGIREIIIVVSYKKEKIMEYFEDGSKFGVSINYVFQKHPKGGTADALSYVKNFVEDKFLVIYGDNVFHPNILREIIEKSKSYDAVLCGKEVENFRNYGILEIERDLVKKIHEKPEEFKGNLANTGLFVLPKEIFECIEETEISERGEYELTDSIQILIKKGFRVGYVRAKEFWIDPNSKEEIEMAKKFLEK